MNKRFAIGALGVLLALVAAGGWGLWRAGQAGSGSADRAQAAASGSPWWGASSAAAGGVGEPTAPASSATPEAEAARLKEAHDRLSPQDRATVAQTIAYEGFMGRMRTLLESTTPRSLSPAQAQQVMDEVDAFQREDYYSLAHALQLKMAVARMAYQGGELNSRLAAMQQQFEREHAALVAKSDPSKDPTFVAFKAEEAAMIAQARRMGAFPDGLTRDQYIVRESEKIRARHYPD